MFIHDYLVTHVDGLMLKFRKAIHQGLRPNPALMFWPKENVKADDGTTIKRVVAMDLDEEDTKNVLVPMRAGAERTRAYALLFIDPQQEQVKAVLETPHGTETWIMKKEYHGDVFVLKDPVRESNVDGFGVFWTQG